LKPVRDEGQTMANEEQVRRAKEYLKTKIREAEASGEAEEITAKYWDEVREIFRRKLDQQQNSSSPS
jgi:hypothetical protein